MSTKDLTNYICGMGNPLLDMSANTTQEQLDRYGLTMGNAILAEEKHLPLYTEIAEAKDVQYVAGGATQNSIRVAQWMLQTPGATNYMGSVGDDTFGAQLKQCLLQDGVGEYYYKDDAATGTCAVLIKDKERSLCANLSAANNFKPSHLETASVQAMWQAAQFYYIGGFFFTVSQESIMTIARHKNENNKTLAINLSAPFICQFFKTGLMEAMPYVDIVFGNETEAAAFGGTVEGLGTDPATVAQYIADLPQESMYKPRLCIITQGKDPTLVAITGGDVMSFPVTPVEPETIVDTNGAGDAFVGGFIAKYVQGKIIDTCVEAGNYAASKIIQVSGCVCPSEAPAL